MKSSKVFKPVLIVTAVGASGVFGAAVGLAVGASVCFYGMEAVRQRTEKLLGNAQSETGGVRSVEEEIAIVRAKKAAGSYILDKYKLDHGHVDLIFDLASVKVDEYDQDRFNVRLKHTSLHHRIYNVVSVGIDHELVVFEEGGEVEANKAMYDIMRDDLLEEKESTEAWRKRNFKIGSKGMAQMLYETTLSELATRYGATEEQVKRVLMSVVSYSTTDMTLGGATREQIEKEVALSMRIMDEEFAEAPLANGEETTEAWRKRRVGELTAQGATEAVIADGLGITASEVRRINVQTAQEEAEGIDDEEMTARVRASGFLSNWINSGRGVYTDKEFVPLEFMGFNRNPKGWRVLLKLEDTVYSVNHDDVSGEMTVEDEGN